MVMLGFSRKPTAVSKIVKRNSLLIRLTSVFCFIFLSASFISSLSTICRDFIRFSKEEDVVLNSNPLFPNDFRFETLKSSFENGGELSLSSSVPLQTPRFAYLISGSKGELEKLWRTLHAIYHPRNQYVVHMDLESPATERHELASRIDRHKVFSEIGNVYMITQANMVTYKGPTMVANTLHACAILLKRSKNWDWFINLSASDYPLITQDDLLHTFSYLNRSLNFIGHTSKLGSKADKRGRRLIIDPGLYSSKKESIFWTRTRRPLPTKFKLFTGSAWMILSHSFVEYLVWGWDNLPRTMLMYYTNFQSSPEGYFHTVICNAPEFAATAVNHDLRYISWGKPTKQHPLVLQESDLEMMILTGAAFARKFETDDVVLDKIDEFYLRRREGNFSFGGWCSGQPLCSEVGDPNKITPGQGALRFKRLVYNVVFLANFEQNRCQ